MRALLIGNYGSANLGDEALREYFLTTFRMHTWTVVTAAPSGSNDVPRLPFGIRSLFRPWWRTVAAMRRSDAVVFGGGTLFTDIESPRACMLWWWHAFVARVLGKPVLLAFQGIGPFRTGVGEWCARSSVRHARLVIVRDQASFDRVKSWNLNKEVVQSFDPVFEQIRVLNAANTSTGLNLVLIPRMNSSPSFAKRVTGLLSSGDYAVVSILSLQPDDALERAVCERLRVLCGSRATVIPVRTLQELATRVKAASLVLSERYHGVISALALERPFEVIAQGEGDKLSTLASAKSRSELTAMVRRGEEALRGGLRGIS